MNNGSRIGKIGSLVLAAILSAGCAPTTQDLIKEGQLTGDWSAFDRRMATIDRHAARTEQVCPSGSKLWCTKRIRDEKCSCVNDSEGRDRLSRLLN
ncbi:MAG: hypothetical protein R3192_14525 [Woeseiaceae bacterium]|nr:hypothetical protein [Woeseiaceae bacterium]